MYGILRTIDTGPLYVARNVAGSPEAAADSIEEGKLRFKKTCSRTSERAAP
jgi:hypothetical protein